MSQTFALVCKEAKLKIWVGQGWDTMTNYYSSMPEVMQRLGRFLEATRGKPLALMCDDTQGSQFEDCVEFEDPAADDANGPNAEVTGTRRGSGAPTG